MTGSIVVIKPEASYFLGDVITFGADTKTQIPTTHRIVKIEGKGTEELITTKGDANDSEDPARTSIKDVHGKVIFHASYVGYLLAFARRPVGFALLVGVPAVLIILDEIGNIWTEIRRLRWEKRKGEKLKRENQIDPLIILLVLAAPLLGFAERSSTSSYYRENEGVVANTLMASSDFGIPVPTIAPQTLEVTPEVTEESTTTEFTESSSATSTMEL